MSAPRRSHRGAYAEREDPNLGWLDQAGQRAAGVVLRRLRARRGRARRVARAALAHSEELAALSESALGTAAAELRALLRRDGLRDDHVARAFGLVRAAAGQTLGQLHYPVQLEGGFVLLSGMVAEMETGEGKTLTATLPAAVAAMAGTPVHVITVNDYLVERDAEAMGPVYRALGLDVGCVVHGMDPAARREAYAREIVYVSNKELAFDYLKDRITLGRRRSRLQLSVDRLQGAGSRTEGLLLRGLHFGIVDEADSVLVDEARTPLIISGGSEIEEVEEQVYETSLELARKLERGRDFTLDEREREARFTDEGEARLASWTEPLGGIWSGRERSEDFVAQALAALHLHQRDVSYLVADGKVQIIDEYTGRVMQDRSWERGLHQMIEAKEGLELTGRTEPLARISYQRFFRRYQRMAGMTGTAHEVAGELWSVYRMPTVRIPTNRRLQRRNRGTHVFARADEKWQAVVERVAEVHAGGRPLLVGTRSVGASEHLSALLAERGLPHSVLNARQDREEAEIVARAGASGRITVATNMAGRGTDIVLDAAAREAGGLHVIATERHEAGRIDRQLFGRGGRQGDPGSYELFASLEDEIVRAHAGPGVLGRLTAASASARLRRWLVRRAQRRAERLHSRIRRELVKLDDRYASLLAFSGRGE